MSQWYLQNHIPPDAMTLATAYLLITKIALKTLQEDHKNVGL